MRTPKLSTPTKLSIAAAFKDARRDKFSSSAFKLPQLLWKSRNGRTILHWIAYHGKLNLVKPALLYPDNLLLPANDTETPLDRAVQRGFIAQLPNWCLREDILTAKHADFYLKCEFTLLHTAASSGTYLALPVKYRQSKFLSIPTANGITVLHFLAGTAQFPALPTFTDPAPLLAMDEMKRTPLHALAKSGQLNLISPELLTPENLSLTDVFGNSPVSLAFEHGFSSQISADIFQQLDVNVQAKAFMHCAGMNGTWEPLDPTKLTLEMLKVRDNCGNTILHELSSENLKSIPDTIIQSLTPEMLLAQNDNMDTPFERFEYAKSLSVFPPQLVDACRVCQVLGVPESFRD